MEWGLGATIINKSIKFHIVIVFSGQMCISTNQLMVVKPLHILLLIFYSAAAAEKPDSGNPKPQRSDDTLTNGHFNSAHRF